MSPVFFSFGANTGVPCISEFLHNLKEFFSSTVPIYLVGVYLPIVDHMNVYSTSMILILSFQGSGSILHNIYLLIQCYISNLGDRPVFFCLRG